MTRGWSVAAVFVGGLCVAFAHGDPVGYALGAINLSIGAAYIWWGCK